MTKIEWTEKTWNPIAGCSRVSPGCQHCYAERMAKRLAAMGQEKYQEVTDYNGRWNGTINLDLAALDIPRKRKKPTIWFVNSMSDLFHENVGVEYAREIWKVMADTPHHTYQILTKRAELMSKIVPIFFMEFGVLPNVWLGVSIEDQQRADERIPYLLTTPAAVRFLSCEPLLGPVDLQWCDWCGRFGPHDCESGYKWAATIEQDQAGIDWVIVGGESGPGARPIHPDWARSLRDQCQEAGVKYFFKQWGAWLPTYPDSKKPDSAICHQWNGGICAWRVGKKKAGRLLDSRTWDEMPEVR